VREIKFRAWLRGKMTHGCVQWHPAKNGEWLVPLEDGNLVTKDATPMQYTGLKDKNGKEIYDGDIVKVSGFSELMEVYFKDGYFGWGKEHRGMYSFDPFGTEDLEVIGNIWENPELLEGVKP
jgi:hypothetical protein